MASLTQWAWNWTTSGRWWRTGKLGMLQSVGLQRVGHGWTTGQQQQQPALSLAPYYKHLNSPSKSVYLESFTLLTTRASYFKDWIFPCSSVGKESACNAGDLGSIPVSGRSPEKEMATQPSILAWRIPWTEEPGRLYIVHGVARVGHDLVTKPAPPLWGPTFIV